MLAIRMQRTGRKGHAMFRFVVQDSRRTPTSGKIVAQLGSYDPHAKSVVLDKEKASFYLGHGAQPSERVARLLKSEGVALPSWVKLNDAKAGTIRHTDKLRRNRSAEEATAEQEPAGAVVEPEASPEEATEEQTPAETETETPAEVTSEDTPGGDEAPEAESKES